MPLIPEATIDLVRQSVDIVEVITDNVILTKRGKNYLGLCPFHDDRHPSLNVSQDKQIYKCFSCGAGGNVFRFLMEIERISFAEAIRKLADRAGITVPEVREQDRGTPDAFDALYAANELARRYYSHLLLEDPSGAEALEYITSRGVSRETVEAFSLGYAPRAWDGLLQVAGRRGIPPQTLETAGLVLPRREGQGFYDRFRHRLMFPIQASSGRTVAFGARALDPQEQAKYLNSPETPIYHKSATLYGLWKARDTIRSEGRALIVEGYMDLIALAQRGFACTVASAGTALTSDHARLLRRYAERATLIFDGDAAGTAAAVRGVSALLEDGLETRVVCLPEGHDPDSHIREYGEEAFGAVVEGAVPALDFLMDWTAGREDLSTADGKARASRFLAETISRVRDASLRKFLIQEAAEKLNVDEGTMILAIEQAPKPPGGRGRRGAAPSGGTAPAFDPHPRSERELLILMMNDGALADAVLKQIEVEEFSNSVYRAIIALIAGCRRQSQGILPAQLVDQCEDPDLARVISDLSMETGILDPDQSEVPLQDYIRKFRLRSLEARIDAVEAEIRSAGSGPDLRPLMEKHRALTAQRKALVESA